MVTSFQVIYKSIVRIFFVTNFGLLSLSHNYHAWNHDYRLGETESKTWLEFSKSWNSTVKHLRV